jgi:GWxTD domain-containing protein
MSGLFGTVGIEFELPCFSNGVYRMEMILRSPDGGILQNIARDFSIKDPQFPLVATHDQLAASTVYISEPDEYRFQKIHKNPDSLKRDLDSFWAGFSQSIPRARSTISGYYARVEEANLMFSTYKEGWKTDPGMIYVLFGAPSSIEKTIDGMAWYYPSNSPEYSKVFFFEMVRNPDGPLPKRNYILRRHQQYERWTQEQVLRLQQGRLD